MVGVVVASIDTSVAVPDGPSETPGEPEKEKAVVEEKTAPAKKAVPAESAIKATPVL